MSRFFFFFFLKILSPNIKRIFFIYHNSLILLLLGERITIDLIKIFLCKNFRRNLNNKIRGMENYKSQIFFQREILRLCDLFLQFAFNILKKKSFLNNSVLHISLKFEENIHKFPTLRVIISRRNDKLMKKLKNSLNNITNYLLKNPVFCSKTFIQKVVWAYFRLEKNINEHLKFLPEIRSFSFFNNSEDSLLLFYFMLKTLQKKKN